MQKPTAVARSGIRAYFAIYLKLSKPAILKHNSETLTHLKLSSSECT
jgi:hypothetical protein